MLQTQVARAQGLLERYDEALAMLDALPEVDAELATRIPIERGRVLNSRGDPEAARPYFEAAFVAASEAGFEHLAVDALHMVAIVAAPYEQAELHRRALSLASEAEDPRARQWRASLLNNYGWTEFDARRLEAALALFEEAVEERRRQGKTAEVQIARWSVARTLREMGRVDEALGIQLALAAEHAAAGTSDPYVDEETAACRAALDGSDPG